MSDFDLAKALFAGAEDLRSKYFDDLGGKVYARRFTLAHHAQIEKYYGDGKPTGEALVQVVVRFALKDDGSRWFRGGEIKAKLLSDAEMGKIAEIADWITSNDEPESSLAELERDFDDGEVIEQQFGTLRSS